MKKIAIFILTILLFQLLEAQTYIMPKIGIGSTKFSLNDDRALFEETASKIGFTAGVAADITLGYGFSLQPEILYVQKGSKLNRKPLESPNGELLQNGFCGSLTNQANCLVTIPNSPEGQYAVFQNLDYSLNYFEVPILVKYTFLGGNVGFFLTAGPTIGFGLSGDFDLELLDRNGRTSLSDAFDSYITYKMQELGQGANDFSVNFGSNPSDEFVTLDIGLSVGGGVYLELGSGKLNLDLRYISGLTNMLNTGNNALFENEAQKNTFLQFSVGYGIPIGG